MEYEDHRSVWAGIRSPVQIQEVTVLGLDALPFEVRTLGGAEHARDESLRDFYKKLIAAAKLKDVSSTFAIEQIKFTTKLPLESAD